MAGYPPYVSSGYISTLSYREVLHDHRLPTGQHPGPDPPSCSTYCLNSGISIFSSYQPALYGVGTVLFFPGF